MRWLLSLLFIASGCLVSNAADAVTYKVGVATKEITPTTPLWMAGYGGRNKPCETKRHDLWVKVLAIEDSSGNFAVLLTSDLCGIPRGLAEDVTKVVMKKTPLKREQISLTCSHTHCGPVVGDNLLDMYPLDAEQKQAVKDYTQKLTGWMVETIVKAFEERKPGKLSIGKGTSRFAVNRREVTAKGVINGKNPTGPVDHDVPVLRVDDENGKLRAVVFGYACHNTTMSFYEWSGDYAGFAQIEIEEKHPGVTALFWIGCGGDANPLPRSKIELCEKYGKDLASGVEDAIKEKMTPLTTKITTRYQEIALELDAIPEKAKWSADALSKNIAVANRAQRMLKILEDGGKIPTSYPYFPVQVWRFGDELTWVTLGGEVVIDYNLRLKKEMADRKAVWITAYANDVPAYIPSERVLKEGGYEGESSMVYYGQPTKWAPGLEERIVKKVLELGK
ncbi:MAG: neutral/alkaline non-lysosomal ceramidase N-terminal domain-containing protein [Planctomycetes bacterium]|nr:neutral/alkaline non-lysosomal ceramidase N-terminal domain-containing protein [Planctomycetota bacterium]